MASFRIEIVETLFFSTTVTVGVGVVSTSFCLLNTANAAKHIPARPPTIPIHFKVVFIFNALMKDQIVTFGYFDIC